MAESSLKMAIQLDENNPDAFIALGDVYSSMGNYYI